MFAEETAFDATLTFLPKQVASTQLPFGSQIKPSEFCKARAAIAIPPAEPVSDIQSPTFASKEVFFVIKTPINPSVNFHPIPNAEVQ